MSNPRLVSELSLSLRLSRLIREIAQVRDGQPRLNVTDVPLLRWDDDDNIYLEIDCADSTAVQADISLRAGRAHINIARL